ncbi:hypothetical protein ACWD25_28490 [Streptomyces sp. NPDC002920]
MPPRAAADLPPTAAAHPTGQSGPPALAPRIASPSVEACDAQTELPLYDQPTLGSI